MVTVLLVRHADIDLKPGGTPRDEPLNAKGRKRAETLVHVLGTAGIATIFTSTFPRTKQTAQPLAAKLGIVPKDDSDEPPVNDIASGAFGEVVLVVGHSDSVPETIAALLDEPPMANLIEREFDNLFVVTRAGPGQAAMVHLKYGEPIL